MTTYVTCFFDIGRKSDAPLQKYENYFSWIEQLLVLDIHLYFFTTAEIHSKFNYKPRDNLRFQLVDDYYYRDRVHWDNYETNNPPKDTKEFAALTHSKFVFVQQAIADNPFGDGYYGWIDAGITKIASHPELLPSLQPREAVSCLLMNYISAAEIKDPKFVMACRYKMCGGFFVGNKVNMNRFCQLMAELIADGIYGLEQEYMAIVYFKQPELFQPYFGDFSDLFTNYERCIHNRWLAKRYLAATITHNDERENQRVTACL